MSSRTDSHTISHAENIYSGNADAGNGSGRGLPLLQLVEADLGTPDVADVDGVCESQANAGAGALTLNGAYASGGVVTMDVPRAVTVDADGVGTSVLTITGTDVYGATLVENITMNGTTVVPGLKAFKTITSIVTDSASTGDIIVGTADRLGLPYAIADAGDLYVGNENNVNAVPAAGTLVAAVTTSPATAITGDVRGTYDPNATLDGSKPVKLVYKPAGRNTVSAYGVPQFAG